MLPKKEYLIFITLVIIPFSSSLDTITTDNPLQDGETLVSPNGNFILGFYSLANSSTNRCVGVWGNGNSQRRLWVANGDNPINGTSGVLSVGQSSGNLELRGDNGSNPIWSTNVSATRAITYYATLLDSGRFVLFSQNSSGRNEIWQSRSQTQLDGDSNSDSGRSNGGNKLTIVLPAFVAGFALLSVAVWLYMKKKKGRTVTDIEPVSEFTSSTVSRGRQEPLLVDINMSSSSYGDSQSGNLIGEAGTDTDLPFFSLGILVAATENFAFHRKLGQGGFGPVYKGELRNGQEIAVKKLSANSGQGVEEFRNEVTLIAKLQHRNLVRLLGYCVHHQEKMLIYEYMPNRGLDAFIFNKDNAALLDWRKRFEITKGVARGMLYLHQDSRLRIVHRDLKANNVLLDADMIPKISDFGMARIVGGEQMEATTNRVVGTYGYMAPEYAMEGHFSIKSDVFSFGVLLLEIISGRRNSSFHKENSVNLIGFVWELWTLGKCLDIVDLSMGNSYDPRELTRCIHVGLLCVQELAGDRPTMTEVVFMLGHETSLPSPKQPAFIFKGSHYGPDTTMSATSVNDTLITVVEAR